MCDTFAIANQKRNLRVTCLHILAALLLLCSALSSFSQTQTNSTNWENLNSQYIKGLISDTVYLNRAADLAGKSLEDIQLKDYLELYKEIAWSKEKYHEYRVRYFSILGNNAAFTYRHGATIYYLNKIEEELKKVTPYINSLNEPRQLLSIYGRNEKENFEKRDEIFREVIPFLKSLPQLISDDKVPPNTCTNAMTILNHASRLYADKQDTGMVNEVVNISNPLYAAVLNKPGFPEDKKQKCLYLLCQIRYTKSLLQKDFSSAQKLLDTSFTLIQSDKATDKLWWESVETALLKKIIDFYILRKKADSARYYLNLLAYKNKNGTLGDATGYLLYSTKLNALEGNFENAYKDLKSAYEINDSVINLQMADINNNLYTQLISEQKQDEIAQLIKQRQRRSILIAIASIAGLVFIIILILLVRKRGKKARKKIEEIRTLTQIQIAELEIKANLIQRKLGMELHDDIAGNLAYLCNTIDTQLIDEHDPIYREHLERISKMARDTYMNARNKSHEWFSNGQKEQELSFKDSIYKLTSYALPDKQFKKTIEIDDGSMQKVSYTTKIELLRIIQEALINILKHSGADEMQLFVYEEDNMIIAQIKDNGKGFDTKKSPKTKGVGLQSLQNRVKELNGIIEIQSSKKGTDLTIAISA